MCVPNGPPFQRCQVEFFCWKNVSSFCSAKATHIFSAKNIKILYIESAKTVNEMTLNELVKLTTLWTTGPRFVHYFLFIPIQMSLQIMYKPQNTLPKTVNAFSEPKVNNNKSYCYGVAAGENAVLILTDHKLDFEPIICKVFLFK